jgi:hypothetical protein
MDMQPGGMDREHEHEAWTCSIGLQNEQNECMMDKQQGHATCTFGMDQQAWTCSRDMEHAALTGTDRGHASWTYRGNAAREMQFQNTTQTCSIETWTCGMDEQHGHAASKCSMDVPHVVHKAWA